MKANTCILLGLLTAFIALFAIETAKAAPASPQPSGHLRQLIDSTLRKINNISDAKQPPLDRTTLMVAQAEYSAKVQTAPPTEQPVYRAALKVVADLVGAVEEHEKAVADYHYSKNLHGKQDREDSKVSNWQRGWDAGAAARADNAKQKMENDASRKALLDKEKFMSLNGVSRRLWQRSVSGNSTASSSNPTPPNSSPSSNWPWSSSPPLRRPSRCRSPHRNQRRPARPASIRPAGTWTADNRQSVDSSTKTTPFRDARSSHRHLGNGATKAKRDLARHVDATGQASI